MRGPIIIFGALCALAIYVEGRTIEIAGAKQVPGGNVTHFTQTLTEEEANDRGMVFTSNDDTEALEDNTAEEESNDAATNLSAGISANPPTNLFGNNAAGIPPLAGGDASEEATDESEALDTPNTPDCPNALPFVPPGMEYNDDCELVPETQVDRDPSAPSGPSGNNNFVLPSFADLNVPAPPAGGFNFANLFNNPNPAPATTDNAATSSSDTAAAPFSSSFSSGVFGAPPVAPIVPAAPTGGIPGFPFGRKKK